MATGTAGEQVKTMRRRIFSADWPLDQAITAIAERTPSHAFLANPSGQMTYLYLTQFVKSCSEQLLGRPFGELAVLDWGCGKGHVTKLMGDLQPASLTSCDVLSEKDDSAFGQATPIIEHFGIQVDPLEHPYVIPYADASFDVVLSVGVLEHVPQDQASLHEIERILKPGGLFFCFFLPTRWSWTQKVAHMRGNDYHDRLYTPPQVRGMLAQAGLEERDMWYRQLLPKNTIRYPAFRTFEKLDQAVTENTPLKLFATNMEFVAQKPV